MSATSDSQPSGSYLDRSFTTTLFNDFAAQTKKTTSFTLRSLAPRITTTTATAKTKLPWLKLALFGDLRTDRNCLRHDANVLKIYGVEGDYDQGQMAVSEAVERLEKAGIAAMVYTSPSHTEDTPRWRVLCPTSVALPPTQRDQLLARVNGVLEGVLSGESWTLSQSYYFGSVNQNPSHRVALIDGTTIDLRDDLDAGAIDNLRTKPTAASTRPVSNGVHAPVSDKRFEGYRRTVLEKLRREAVDGHKHFALLRCATTLGGIQADAGFDDQTAIQWMLETLPDTVQDWKLAERTARDGLARGRANPLELEERPPQTDRCLDHRTSPPPTAPHIHNRPKISHSRNRTQNHLRPRLPQCLRQPRCPRHRRPRHHRPPRRPRQTPSQPPSQR